MPTPDDRLQAIVTELNAWLVREEEGLKEMVDKTAVAFHEGKKEGFELALKLVSKTLEG